MLDRSLSRWCFTTPIQPMEPKLLSDSKSPSHEFPINHSESTSRMLLLRNWLEINLKLSIRLNVYFIKPVLFSTWTIPLTEKYISKTTSGRKQTLFTNSTELLETISTREIVSLSVITRLSHLVA